MHSLDIIIARNDRAAGREMAHRVTSAPFDEQGERAWEAFEAIEDSDDVDNYRDGYTRGRQEG
jgi:hypothetical protein